MIKFTKEHAKLLLDWYDKEGRNNWGGWGNYPSLPSGASYHSYDDCHLRILFDEPLQLEGEDEAFNCISDSRRVPGKKVDGIISIFQLQDYVLTEEEHLTKRYDGYKKDWERSQKYKKQMEDYDSQSEDTKMIISTLEDKLSSILGTPGSKISRKEIETDLSQYHLPIISCQNTWMEKAWKFNSAEEYANYKLNK